MGSIDKLPTNKGNESVSPWGHDEVIDRLDCVQRDFAEFKRYVRVMFREELDRYLKEVRKPRRYVEPGYR
jgi:hypothetical protein